MRKIIMGLMGFALCACASYYTTNGEKQYIQNKNGAPLVVPAPLTGENISHFHDLPEQTQNPKVNIAPPAN